MTYLVHAQIDEQTLWWQRGKWLLREETDRKLPASSAAEPRTLKGARRMMEAAFQRGATSGDIYQRSWRRGKGRARTYTYKRRARE